MSINLNNLTIKAALESVINGASDFVLTDKVLGDITLESVCRALDAVNEEIHFNETRKLNNRRYMQDQFDILIDALYGYEGENYQNNIDISIRSAKEEDGSMLDVTYSVKLLADDAKVLHFEERDMHNVQYEIDEDTNTYRQIADEWWVLDDTGDMVAAI